jgi:hypothetical protein
MFPFCFDVFQLCRFVTACVSSPSIEAGVNGVTLKKRLCCQLTRRS